MTEEVTTEKKKVNYFSWEFVKSPTGHRVIIALLVVAFAVWYIFKKVPDDNSKDALIEQKNKETDSLKYDIRETNDYIKNVLFSKLESLEVAVNKKENEKTKIIERTEVLVRDVSGFSVSELQSEYDRRYPTPK